MIHLFIQVGRFPGLLGKDPAESAWALSAQIRSFGKLCVRCVRGFGTDYVLLRGVLVTSTWAPDGGSDSREAFVWQVPARSLREGSL